MKLVVKITDYINSNVYNDASAYNPISDSDESYNDESGDISRLLSISLSNNSPDTIESYIVGRAYLTGYSYSNYVAAIPEPETYAMLLAGLRLLGFKRRKLNNPPKAHAT